MASDYSLPDRELCCLDVETGKRACTKKPILELWMQFSFLGLNWRKSHIYKHRDRRHADRCTVLKTVTDMHFHSSWGCFSTWFIAMIKRNIFAALNMSWKTNLHRYTNQIALLLLSFTELVLLAINISTSYMAKKKKKHQKSQWMH